VTAIQQTNPAVPSPARPPIARGSVRAWVLVCRPATLSVAVAPVAVGAACAHTVGSFRLGPALAALAGALLLQVAANLANDVFDHERGADTAERLGPTRAVQSGLLSAQAVRLALAMTLGLSVLVGLYLACVATVAVVIIGLCAIASALAYTAGPYPLGYHGLGDLFVLVFFGFVAVCGTAYVQVLAVPELAWWCSVPVGLLATAVLVVNNVRDRETDAKAGKLTLAVRLGRRGAVAEYAALVLLAHAVPPALVALGKLGPLGLLPLLTLVPALRLALRVARETGRALNAALVQTAQLLLGNGLLLAASVALGAGGP
jgi:1,4-dihydroxy-2-naphthoate octaprenyltransferase